MTKDVLITISGLQIADDTSAQPVEVITSGEYYCRNGKHVAEVSCKMNTGVVRCEEAADSMYESIDLLADKLSRQVQKFKDKSLGSDKTSIRTDGKEPEAVAEAEE